MDYRVKPQDFCMADAMPFQQHYEARIDRTIEDVLSEKLFLDVATSLRVGDKVTLCAYEDKSFAEIREIAEFRVLDVEHRHYVKLFMVGDVVKVDVPEKEGDTPVYTVKRGRPGTFYIEGPDGVPLIDDDGDTRLFNRKKDAEDFAEQAA